MLYWIYDVPSFLVVGLFVAVSVGVCWMGIIFLRPFIARWLHQDGGLNEISGGFPPVLS